MFRLPDPNRNTPKTQVRIWFSHLHKRLSIVLNPIFAICGKVTRAYYIYYILCFRLRVDQVWPEPSERGGAVAGARRVSESRGTAAHHQLHQDTLHKAGAWRQLRREQRLHLPEPAAQLNTQTPLPSFKWIRATVSQNKCHILYYEFCYPQIILCEWLYVKKNNNGT